MTYKSTQAQERRTDLDERDVWLECNRLYGQGFENEHARREVSHFP